MAWGTAAFVALLMAMCDRRFSATQYALLSTLASLGRVYVGPAAGAKAESFGWQQFFFATSSSRLGVLMLWSSERASTRSTIHPPTRHGEPKAKSRSPR